MSSTPRVNVIIGAQLDPRFMAVNSKFSSALSAHSRKLESLRSKQAVINSYKEQRKNSTDLAKSLSKERAELAKLEAEFKEIEKPTRRQTEGLDRQRQKLDRLSESYDKSKRKVRAAYKEMRIAGVTASNLTSKSAKLSKRIARAQFIGGVRSSIGQSLQGSRAMFSGAQSLGFKAFGVGAGLGVASIPSIGFEDASLRAAVLARGNESGKGSLGSVSAALQADAFKFARGTEYSGTEVAKAMSFMAMTGFNQEKIRQSFKPIANLATAGGLGIEQTADFATNIASGFGLGAKDIGRVSDILAKTFTTTNTTLYTLGETLKYVGPIASSTGTSLESVSAMAGLLGSSGLQGSEAGTALRASFSRLSAPTSEAMERLDELGVETQDAEGNLRPMPELLKEIAKGMGGMGTGEKMAALKEIFGEEPAAAMSLLLRAAETGTLDEQIRKTSEAKGANDALAKTLRGSTLMQLRQLKSNFLDSASILGQSFLPSIVEASKELKSFTDLTVKFFKDNPDLKNLAVKGSAAAGGMLAVGAVLKALGALIKPFRDLIKGYGRLIDKGVARGTGAVLDQSGDKRRGKAKGLSKLFSWRTLGKIGKSIPFFGTALTIADTMDDAGAFDLAKKELGDLLFSKGDTNTTTNKSETNQTINNNFTLNQQPGESSDSLVNRVMASFEASLKSQADQRSLAYGGTW